MTSSNSTIKKIASILYCVRDEKGLRKMLEDLLTPSEILDVAERISIVQHLLKGKSQREVAKKLGVSISKVTRGSQLLQYGNGALAKLLR